MVKFWSVPAWYGGEQRAPTSTTEANSFTWAFLKVRLSLLWATLRFAKRFLVGRALLYHSGPVDEPTAHQCRKANSARSCPAFSIDNHCGTRFFKLQKWINRWTQQLRSREWWSSLTALERCPSLFRACEGANSRQWSRWGSRAQWKSQPIPSNCQIYCWCGREQKGQRRWRCLNHCGRRTQSLEAGFHQWVWRLRIKHWTNLNCYPTRRRATHNRSFLRNQSKATLSNVSPHSH